MHTLILRQTYRTPLTKKRTCNTKSIGHLYVGFWQRSKWEKEAEGRSFCSLSNGCVVTLINKIFKARDKRIHRKRTVHKRYCSGVRVVGMWLHEEEEEEEGGHCIEEEAGVSAFSLSYHINVRVSYIEQKSVHPDTCDHLIIGLRFVFSTAFWFFKVACPSDVKIRSIISVSLHLQFLLKCLWLYLYFLMACGLEHAVGHSHCYQLSGLYLITMSCQKWKHTFIV